MTARTGGALAPRPQRDGGRGGGPGDRAARGRVYPRRAYPGQADQAGQVRAFLARVLAGCPAAAEVVLMANELAANAVLHSRSGQAGGQFTVRVEVRDGQWVQVAVTDEGGPGQVRLRGIGCGDAGDFGVGLGGGEAGLDGAGRGRGQGAGQGLRIVDALADEWGAGGDADGRTVWFWAGWGAA